MNGVSEVQEKNKIKRSDLKNNILQRVIFRVDYKGIIGIDDSVIKKIGKILSKCDNQINDWEYNVVFMREIDFGLNDPDAIETKLVVPIKELNEIKTYKFSSVEYSTDIFINKYYTTMKIGTAYYKKFDFYNKLFANIVKIIREDNEYIKFLRTGLRKINAILLKDVDSINSLFEEYFFCNINRKLSLKSVFTRNESVDNFYVDKYDFNLIRAVNEVEYEDENAYQVVLDIDGYTKDSDLLNKMDEENELLSALYQINEYIFNVFKDNLKKEFLEELSEGKSNPSIMRGVNENDEDKRQD